MGEKKIEKVHLSPAEYVIHVFMGVRKAARAIGLSATSVSKWKKPKGKDRGCDGRVPGNSHLKILEVATKDGLDITPADLIYGRSVEKG